MNDSQKSQNSSRNKTDTNKPKVFVTRQPRLVTITQISSVSRERDMEEDEKIKTEDKEVIM